MSNLDLTTIDDFKFNKNHYFISYKDKQLDLSHSKFVVLTHLVENKGLFFSVEEIKQLANYKARLAFFFWQLRKVIKEIDPDFNRIKFKKQCGYRYQ